MLKPAPTTPIAPHLARGIVHDHLPTTATKPAFVVLAFPNTSYQLHLEPATPVGDPVGSKIVGTIRADAKRIDVVTSGGRYVEPVFGRPRRVQGVVVARDESAHTITVNAGVPIICRLTDERQKADQFEPGDFVSFDVERGATFTAQS